MLGQSKTATQAEIDSACELIDFWRYNVHFARQILAEQPESSPGIWNRIDHRPLEGFVYAITPFNFTAIAGNLPTAPALMGNTVVWKPAPTQQFAAHFLMRLLEEAGLPPGVINLVTGDGIAVSEVALASPDLAGIHFTGSTPVFQHLWRTVGENIASYRGYPRIVGETGGKDFVVAHPRPTSTCCAPRWSAAPSSSRARSARRPPAPTSRAASGRSSATTWSRRRSRCSMGDVTDFSHFMGAVIDRKSFAKLSGVLDRAKDDDALTVVAGGTADDSEGFFVRPTIIEGTDPGHEVFTTEYFGPILGGARLRRRRLRHRADADGVGGAVRADRVDHRPGPGRRSRTPSRSCASRRATSTSTTSRPAPSSASSPSAGRGRPAPTTRPAPRRT